MLHTTGQVYPSAWKLVTAHHLRYCLPPVDPVKWIAPDCEATQLRRSAAAGGCRDYSDKIFKNIKGLDACLGLEGTKNSTFFTGACLPQRGRSDCHRCSVLCAKGQNVRLPVMAVPPVMAVLSANQPIKGDLAIFAAVDRR